MKYKNLNEIVEACYSYLESHLCEGVRWGYRYRFYKPSSTKYGPYQWLWDSGWHMIVWSHRNVNNSVADLETMLHFQRDDGFIPEMIFWEPPSGLLYSLFRKFFGYSDSRFTDITQMPMLAYSLRAIWEKTEDKNILRKFLPALYRYYMWWKKTRDPDGDGLVSIIHPWESGLDASPLYDPAHGVRNPGFWKLYPKFLKLLRLYRKWGWDMDVIMRRTPFNFEDVGVCSVYADCWGVLGKLAENIDDEIAKECYANRDYFTRRIIEKCWNDEKEMFVSYYHKNNGEFISDIVTVQCLFPLLLDLPDDMENILEKKIRDPKIFGTPFPVPSVAACEETFNPEDSRLLWRGPTWPVTDWIVMEGLLSHGRKETAEWILDRWIDNVRRHGIWEYHNPITGEGEGQEGLGMSTVIVDMAIRLGKIDENAVGTPSDNPSAR